MCEEARVFQMLANSVQKALSEQGFFYPTEPQIKAIPLVLSSENLLLVAPTGSGKTEAVLLPIFSRILQNPTRQGISVLFITPLRALNRDMLRRMSYWSSKLNISIEVRHGDTEVKIRRKQAIHPPEILVTTPETLQAILPGSLMQKHLRHLSCVVMDEVHEYVTSKRGVQLSVALERLFELVGSNFQRIGLSATVENPAKVAKFIAGERRKIRVLKISLEKNYTYAIEFPVASDNDFALAQKLNTAPEAAARIRRMLDLVKQHTSTLIFVNSRTNAEILGHRLGLLAGEIAVHHGSLSREERMKIENAFKANAIEAIVCTSTLELGIDIGQVDLTIQYLSPRQVSSLIQRVGRSGHRLDLVSKGVIITAFSEDTLESLAAVNGARSGKVEPTIIHENALDVVAHQIVGILIDKGITDLDTVLEIITRAYPFRTLSKTKLLDVMNYLHLLRVIKLEGMSLKKTKHSRNYYYRNLTMIPDERRYPIVNILSDRRIGTLGDEFMALRARIGLSFICKGKVWRIVQIEDETGTVHVVPSEDKFAAIPGWDGEMLPIPYDLAKEVGILREAIAKKIKQIKNIKKVTEQLAKKFEIKEAALLEPVKEVNAYLKENLPLPTHHHILLEAFGNYIVIHACFGEIVNRTLGSIFDAILSNHELIVGWWNDGYRLLLEIPQKVGERTLARVSRLIFNRTSDEIDKAFDEYLESRFPFSYKMKFVAERFGALPRGRTMSPERMAELPSRFRNTPVYEETIREAMLEKVDLITAKRIMEDVKAGNIKISMLVRLEQPTPLAYHILAKYSEISELQAPNHVFISNVARMKRAILMGSVKLLCFNCGTLLQEKRLRDLREEPVCSKCSSRFLAKMMRRQSPDRLWDLLQRRQNGETLDSEELDELIYSRRTADLILSYGKKAIIALQTRGIGPETAFRILGRMHPNEDDFYADLLKGKIQYLRTKPFWERKKRVGSK